MAEKRQSRIIKPVAIIFVCRRYPLEKCYSVTKKKNIKYNKEGCAYVIAKNLKSYVTIEETGN